MLDLKADLSGSQPLGRAVLLLAKSAFAAAPMQAMQRLTERIQRQRGPDEPVVFALSQQGMPALRTVMLQLRGITEAGGRVVAALAYEPTGRKQSLRA